jgi:drug/metabolite transporter (DMT)-like permease
MTGTHFRPLPALALLLAIGALLGLTGNLVKLAGNAGWQPMAYLLWSLIGGGLLLLLFAWLRGERPGLSPRLQRYYLGSGLLSIALPNGLLFSSISHVGAGFASMCLAFPPLITYLLALALRMEGLSRIRLLGICVGLLGSLLLALGKLNSGDSPMLWVLAALCVPVFLALGNVYRSRYWPSGASPLSLAPGMLLGGAALLVPMGLFGIEFSPRLDSVRRHLCAVLRPAETGRRGVSQPDRFGRGDSRRSHRHRPARRAGQPDDAAGRPVHRRRRAAGGLARGAAGAALTMFPQVGCPIKNATRRWRSHQLARITSCPASSALRRAARGAGSCRRWWSAARRGTRRPWAPCSR